MIGIEPQKCERCGKVLNGEEIEYIAIEYDFTEGFTPFLCKEHRDELLEIIRKYIEVTPCK